ncbi:unnamed protein product [Chironomus riparius]|uniref:MD-2-related lipid-recognition domain-containing protein n=1 Tax=Chironomus riparius TaxID=315576 RepID=A0A9N9S4G0_9DIPT|nr:unnamed protein product [Chironomus riparius]
MFKLVALTVLLALSGTQAFWTACPGVLAPTSVTSDVCSGSSCNVRLGQDFSGVATVSFTRAHAILTTRITIYIGGVGVDIPQDAPHDNICNSLFRDGVLTGCPTTPNVATEWRINLTVTSNTPTVNNARVRFEGLENGVSEVCVDVMASIVA